MRSNIYPKTIRLLFGIEYTMLTILSLNNPKIIFLNSLPQSDSSLVKLESEKFTTAINLRKSWNSKETA